MDVIWWGVPIAACVALAGCIAAALLPPRRDHPENLRALANTRRLTRLPEYVRAARRHTIRAGIAVGLLVIALAATALASARPTGLPAPDRDTTADQPEDIMICAGGPATDPAVGETLRYFAEQVRGFGTERIGLTSANRRVIPLTRDHQYAAGRFARDTQSLVSPVSYVDYTASVQDVLAMCLTGFPDDDTATRRSLIYVGPGALSDGDGPALFTAQQVRELASDAGVQVNAVTDEGSLPADLARESGGRVHAQDGDIGAALDDIRGNPPQAQRDAEDAAARSVETPELPLVIALLALPAVLIAGRRRRYALMVAAVLLLVAVWRPVLGGAEPSVTRIAGEREPNVFLIVDRSAAMPASARNDIDAMIDRHPGARFALISFDARPSLDWPLSADTWSLRPILDAAAPYARGAEGSTNVGAASNVLRYQLIGAAAQFPKAQNLVYYFGAGAPDSTAPQRDFRIPEGTVDGGAVFGYGEAGAPRLRAVADQIGVPYLLDDEDPPEAAPAAEAPEPASATSGFELYWALASAASLLILFELYHALRHLRRTRLDRIEVGR